MKFTFIRHTSVDVAPETIYGQTDVCLKPTFEEEARKVLEQISDVEFNHVFSSPLTRCRKLATFCGFADATLDSRLMELNFGEWEMKTGEMLKNDNRLNAWLKDYFNIAAPGGESFNDQKNRVADFIADVKKSAYNHVAVFTHGGVIMSALILSGKIDPADMFKYQPGYGGIVELTF